MGLDLNSVDNKLSTPLHWAAFSGAELSLGYLLAWNVDINCRDFRGLTPLHLAIKSSENNRTSRSIKHLLIKGADKTIEDNDGKRPIDLVKDLRTPAMRDEIVQLLQTDERFLRDCLMLRPPLKKTHRSYKMLIAFYVLSFLSYFMANCFIFPNYDNATTKSFLFYSLCLTFLFCTAAFLRDPGYLYSDPKLTFLELIETFDASCLCPDCGVIKTPRSRHCNVCERCVDRFDHHCPWINNCVGKRNHGIFYCYLVFQLTYIIMMVYFLLWCKFHESH